MNLAKRRDHLWTSSNPFSDMLNGGVKEGRRTVALKGLLAKTLFAQAQDGKEFTFEKSDPQF